MDFFKLAHNTSATKTLFTWFKEKIDYFYNALFLTLTHKNKIYYYITMVRSQLHK